MLPSVIRVPFFVSDFICIPLFLSYLSCKLSTI